MTFRQWCFWFGGIWQILVHKVSSNVTWKSAGFTCQNSCNSQGCVTLKNVCLLAGCLTSQQQANVSQGWIWSDKFICCHTEIEVADQTFYLTQSQYTDTGPTSPNTDPITPGAWQGSHWSANFWVTGMTRHGKILSQAEARFEPRIFCSLGGHLNH